MTACPRCGASLGPGGSVCTSCGCDAAEATASFGAVESVTPTPSDDTAEGPVLVVSKGPQLGERFFIDRAVLTVGRDPQSDIFLNDMTVSRSHARFDLAGGEVTVSDLGSLNGTYVNGVCVDKAALSGGDVVQIGTFQMVYFAGPESTNP